MEKEQREAVSRAVALLAAGQLNKASVTAVKHVINSYRQEGVADADLITGLVNVSNILLIMLSSEAEIAPNDVLQDIASKYGEQ